jgi:hypothetical protein
LASFVSNALPLFFLARSSEYDFIRLDYEMIFHYYLLYRITAETAVTLFCHSGKLKFRTKFSTVDISRI